jgi:FkbM family methyltransferase
MPLAPQTLQSRSSLESFARSHAGGVYYGDHRLLCRLLGDQLAFVDTRDLMLGPRLVLDGFWESWVTLAVARYLKPGMHCIDVGANYGYYTLLMVSAVGPTGRVLACEPNPLLAQIYLPQNLALNGFHRGVDICPHVITNVNNERVDFVLHDQDFATSSLAPWAYEHRNKTISVATTSIDALCVDWPRIDLVKIDAEGAEALGWAGMEETRQKSPHVAIVLELHVLRDPTSTARLIETIQRDGYPLRAIQYDGSLASVSAQRILQRPDEHWTLWVAK